MGRDELAAELQSEFVALQDVPDFLAGPILAGGRIFVTTFVLCELRAGRFVRIRSAEYRKMAEPPPPQ
jgi:hypothetical protein